MFNDWKEEEELGNTKKIVDNVPDYLKFTDKDPFIRMKGGTNATFNKQDVIIGVKPNSNALIKELAK